MDAVSPELIRRAQAGNVEAQIALGREFEVRNDTRRRAHVRGSGEGRKRSGPENARDESHLT